MQPLHKPCPTSFRFTLKVHETNNYVHLQHLLCSSCQRGWIYTSMVCIPPKPLPAWLQTEKTSSKAFFICYASYTFNFPLTKFYSKTLCYFFLRKHKRILRFISLERKSLVQSSLETLCYEMKYEHSHPILWTLTYTLGISPPDPLLSPQFLCCIHQICVDPLESSHDGWWMQLGRIDRSPMSFLVGEIMQLI